MKIASFRQGGERRIGVVDDERQAVAPFDLPAEAAREGLLALIDRGVAPGLLAPVRLADIVLEAPIPRPRRNILCIGKNYREHASEHTASSLAAGAAKGAAPENPIVFTKFPECVVAHCEAVLIDSRVSRAIDYEAELAVIIGKGGRAIPASAAMDHVWGYTIVNDVTARDLQVRHQQWLIGKSQDTFCPMGPWAVTRDAIDLGNTRIRCWINGELRQDGNTRDLIFDVPTIIATISAGITLTPGDVIATGTPAGVGVGFKPPRFLAPGDVARIEVDGIGVLENPFRAIR
jgi:2-keto-4-pentenoate hydratase/2-oxohepta-3-ene-1,7-dioic acid hydratase in catechol pathway